MEQILLSTTVLAAFLGGIVALMAPCCVSVMLPAYFASSFRRRSQILGMTLVFAAGVGTVILPIALGASALSRLFIERHTLIFSVGGALMIAAGAAMLAGWKFMLPMPSRRGGGQGVGSVYSLGAFSGIASACCAPVLAGVAAVSGAVSSFPAALAVGVAYVFGMVAPLAVLALVWDRRDWGSSRLLARRSVRVLPGLRKRVPLATALSGWLMIAMGVLTAALAAAGPGMATDGWEVRVSAYLGHVASRVQDALGFLPGWASAFAVFAALAVLVALALRQSSRSGPHSDRAAEQPSDTPADAEPPSTDGAAQIAHREEADVACSLDTTSAITSRTKETL